MNFIKPKFWKNNNILVYFLLPLTIITKIIILLKNNQQNYDPKIATICVGNIYLGGTGKTQLVLKINQFLKKKYKTFVIKKYYKNQFDEQQLLKKKTKFFLPKSPFFLFWFPTKKKKKTPKVNPITPSLDQVFELFSFSGVSILAARL